MGSGVLRVARGGCGAIAPPLAARPELESRCDIVEFLNIVFKVLVCNLFCIDIFVDVLFEELCRQTERSSRADFACFA